METINIQLLFPTQVKAQLLNLSQTLGKITASSFVLSMHTPPHVTLFSFTPEDDLPRLAPKMHSVSFSGLCKFGDEGGKIWVAVTVVKTPGLIQLREELLTTLGNPRPSRKNFDPHVTIGNVAKGDFEKIVVAVGSHPLLQMGNIPCKLARYASVI